MLSQSRATAMLPVVDMKRARDFYEQNLGPPPARVRESGEVRYETGGLSFVCLPLRPGSPLGH